MLAKVQDKFESNMHIKTSTAKCCVQQIQGPNPEKCFYFTFYFLHDVVEVKAA